MAAAAAAVALLPPEQTQPLVVPTLWRQKRNICIFAGVYLLAFALSVVGCVLSSHMGMASVKEGTRLHIVPSQALLQQVQEEAGLTCDDTCLASAGKVFIVTSSDQNVKQICGHAEGQEPSTGGRCYTNRAFTEQPGVVNDTLVALILYASCFGCFALPVMYCVLHRAERGHKVVQQAISQGDCPTFCMSLSSASVGGHAGLIWGQGGYMRRQLMIGPRVFDILLILFALPLYICAAAIKEERLLFVVTAVSVTVGLMTGRLVNLLCFCCKSARRTVRPQVQEIAFVCITNRQAPLVCIVFDGVLTVFRNLGHLPQRPPANVNLPGGTIGRSQLVPLREDQSDEGSRIVGWSLRVIVGMVRKEQWWHCQRGPQDTQWDVWEHFFPVDPARAHDFFQWLSEEPQRGVFRFCGTATSRDEVWPVTVAALTAPFVAGPGLPELEAGRAAANPETLPPLDRPQTMVLNLTWREDSRGKLSVVLFTLGGTVAAELTARARDTVADFLREVAVHPCCNLNRVSVVLPDGRMLERVDARAKLGEVLCRPPV